MWNWNLFCGDAAVCCDSAEESSAWRVARRDYAAIFAGPVALQEYVIRALFSKCSGKQSRAEFIGAGAGSAWRRRQRQVREPGSYLLRLRWINVSASDWDKQTRCRSYHPGRTTPSGLLAGRRAVLRTEGWFCLGFVSASPKYPGPW